MGWEAVVVREAAGSAGVAMAVVGMGAVATEGAEVASNTVPYDSMSPHLHPRSPQDLLR